MMDLESLLPDLTSLARRAGAAILAFYTPDLTAAHKLDGSPVTAADQAAEDIILPGLRALTPDIPIVSEEAFAAGQVPDVSAGRFWLVDPLDGTKEFIKRNGEFTVNIALVQGGLPVLGVVFLPATGELFTGHGPGTARRTGPGRTDGQPVGCRRVPAGGLTVAVSRSHADTAKLAGFMADKDFCGWMVAGSSLKFCRIAQGLADLYPRLGPTMEWDTAAGQAVLTAAGGRVETLDGQPLTYGKPGFVNPHFIASGH